MDEQKRSELYTAKLEVSQPFKTTKITLVASAMTGKVEDVHEGMEILVKALREVFPKV